MRIEPILNPNSKLALVGEAPGAQEDFEGLPFVGASGQELDRMLEAAGILRQECTLTNVFLDRPPGNKLEAYCGTKREATEAYSQSALIEQYPDFPWPKTYTWTTVQKGKYIMPEHLGELARLRQELCGVNPTVVVPLGATALWALCGDTAITRYRGTAIPGKLVPFKCIPTFHPAYVLRVWKDRVVVITDLMKAKRHTTLPTDYYRPKRYVLIEPTVEDIVAWGNTLNDREPMAVDIETMHGQIDCIGFAQSPTESLCIPFIDKRRSNWCYWSTANEEVKALLVVMRLLARPMPKIFQNGMYDLQYLWIKYGIRVTNASEDTMLKHHSMYPELKKDLGFLGSIYTDEAPWKLMRTRKDDWKKED